MLKGIVAKDVPSVWEKVAPMIQRAIDKGNGDENIYDVRTEIDKRNAQLWVNEVNGEIIAAAVTKILVKPRKKICSLAYVGGEGLKEIINLQGDMVKWAKDNGCSCFEGYARKGWTRVLKDWRIVWTTIRMEI